MGIKFSSEDLYAKNTNLHLHSNHSDGELEVDKLVEKCKGANLGLISLTDHDAVSGQAEFLAFAEKSGLKALSGVEFEVVYKKMRFHVLGYNFDYQDKEVLELCSRYRDFRKKYGEIMLEKVNKQLVVENKAPSLKVAELKEKYGEVTASRHLTSYLADKGITQTQEDAWRNYIFPNREMLEVDGIEVLNIIKKAGGFTVLAHLGSKDFSFTKYGLSISDQEKIISELKSYGLDGIEVYYPGHSEKQTKDYLEIAQNLKLLKTKGSDFHSDNTNQNTLIF